MFKLSIIAMGNKMPRWVDEASLEYQKRLKEYVQIHFIEVPLLKRGKAADLRRILEKETATLMNLIPVNCRIIALDMQGISFSSEQMALKFESLSHINTHLCFIIGGPEGLSPDILAKADERWSLSQLTLAHPMVRILLLEAVYRAWSIIHHHPYHK